VNGSSAGGAGVGAGPAAAAAAAAVAAFLRRTAPPEPFSVATLGAYRALCLPAPDGPDGPTRVVALLAGEDGAVYAPAGDEVAALLPALPDLLRGLRLRPTGTTLALRIPTAVSGAPPRPGRFTLWASPAYLAASGGDSGVWK
jgi:hypothetical protein